MARIPLDITKTLYDSDGYRHTLVRATPAQILTLVEGFYWLWDRRSGRCLVEGMASNRLSNTRPAGDDLQAGRDPVAETRAFFMAEKAVRSAAASATAVLAHVSSAARGNGTAPRLAMSPPARPAAPAGRQPEAPKRIRTAAPAATTRSLLAATLTLGFLALALLTPSSRRPGSLR